MKEKNNMLEAWAVIEHGKPLQKITEPLPELTGSEVLVEVTHCGVCHSDIHFWEGFFDLGQGKRFNVSERTQLPRAIGHEIVGKVIQFGPDVEEVQVGQSRIVYPWLGCGKCSRCAQGLDNYCVAQKSIGVASHGGFASHVVVPHPKYPIDHGDIDPAVACTFACSGITVLSAIRKIMPLAPRDAVVLIGAGGLGLAAIAMLQALGHEKIITMDIRKDNCAAAVRAGATAAVDGSEGDVFSKILAQTGGPVLAAIDFVNNSTTAPLALSILARGGRMVQVGVMGGELNLSLVGLIFSAATIMGNNTGSPEELREVATLAREGRLAPIPITKVSWDQSNSALMDLRAGKATGRIVLIR